MPNQCGPAAPCPVMRSWMRIGCPTCAATARLRMQSKAWSLLSSESAPKPLVKRPAPFVVVLALALALDRAPERGSVARALAENGWPVRRDGDKEDSEPKQPCAHSPLHNAPCKIFYIV